MQTTDQEVTVKTAQQMGLSEGEFEEIQKVLGREPNLTELSIYAAMWSERCSLKNSLKWLRTLPSIGKRLSTYKGEESTVLFDIGDGIGCVLTINSQNHFVEVEPNRTTTTLSGGETHWNILASGAQPIAQLNSLRFGIPNSSQTQNVVKKVVNELACQGNILGVPTVRSNVSFHENYEQNVVINTMTIGVAKIGESKSSRTIEPGNPVFIVGAKFDESDASEKFKQETEKLHSAVGEESLYQAKLLWNGILEATDTDALVGIQVIEFAGIACACASMCADGEMGMVINLEKIPVLQEDLKDRDLLFNASQGSALIVVAKAREQELFNIFEKWDLEYVQIGEVTETGILEYELAGEKVATVPANSLVMGGGAPIYDQATAKPRYFHEIKRFNLGRVKSPKNIVEAAKKLFSSPNLVSKRWVSEQFDSMVLTNNLSTNAPSDAEILRLNGTEKLLALTMDGNSNYVYADPYIGAMIAVSEAARNITCAGGVPMAVTSCLNFGDPYDPEVYYLFVNAVKGLGEACRKFDTPVFNSHASFYNESVIKGRAEPIIPTPIIGMLGTIKDSSHQTSLHFKEEGDMIYMLGNLSNDLGGSEYLRTVLNIQHSPPPEFDLYEEFEIQKHIRKLIHQKIVRSAHSVSSGGLFTNLMESAILSNLGFNIETVDTFRKDSFLFGEGQSRIVITIAPEQEDALQNYLINNNVSFSKLGEVFGDVAIIDEENFGSINHWKRIYEDTLSNKLDE